MKKFISQKRFTVDWMVYLVFSIILGFSLLQILYEFTSSSFLISILEFMIIVVIIIPIWSLLYETYIIKNDLLIIKHGVFIKKISIPTIEKIQINTKDSSIGLVGQINTFKTLVIHYGEKGQVINIIPKDISIFILCIKDINKGIEVYN